VAGSAERDTALSLAGPGGEVDGGGIAVMPASPDEPRLVTPPVDRILRLADAPRSPSPDARRAILVAMRTAAEKRVTGVTGSKRRRHYGHAAELVCACAVLDATPETALWIAGIRDAYRRFPAVQAELARPGCRS
jgi:hypothetical protein